MGRTISSRATLLQRLLSGLAAIAFLILVATIFTGILLLELSYCAYHALVIAGLTPGLAALTVGFILFLFILIFLGLAWGQWLKTRNLPRQIMLAGMPLTGKVHNTIEAFITGLGFPRS